eukprot:g26550.t1
MTEQDSAYAQNENNDFNRRGFLKGAGGAFGAAGLAGPLSFLQTKTAAGHEETGRHRRCGTKTESPYGPIAPVKDEATGLELIQLPKGFSYTTFSWRGDKMDDGNIVASGHDGMAVVKSAYGWDWSGRGRNRRRCRVQTLYLIRNQEVFGVGNPTIAPDFNYDSQGGGGTSVLIWRNGRFAGHHVSISGTVANCAGGPTPWGTWLTCEEGTDEGDLPHGYPFECTVKRVTNPTPLKAMGRFKHEAVAFDPRTGVVYETEDNSARDGSSNARNRGQSLFYRFIPKRRFGSVGSLLKGGKLQAAVVVDKNGDPVDDLRIPRCGAKYRVKWVDIDDPDIPVGANGASGPYLQGRDKGATRFQRLEGCWFDPKKKRVVFNDTEGGEGLLASDRGEGAVFAYDPRHEVLEVLFVAQLGEGGVPTADNPDNVTVGPKGEIFLCEDGGRDVDGFGLSLLGLTRRGETFEFARNNINISSGDADALVAAGHDPAAVGTGDFTGQEWAGATFSPDGNILFVNIQTPGITFAITGPWRRGLLCVKAEIPLKTIGRNVESRRCEAAANRAGAVLFVVMVVVALLMLAAYQFAARMGLEHQSAVRCQNRVRLRAAVDSGLEYTLAHLASRKRWKLSDAASIFRDQPVGDDDIRAPRLSVLAVDAAALDSHGDRVAPELRFGVADESGRLNVNALARLPDADARRMLMSVPRMTNDIAAAILDWIDADETPRTNGAELEWYSQNRSGLCAMNRPLQSIHELLLVRDVTPELLYGDDANRNGRRDSDEERDGFEWHAGWRAYLTVDSAESNLRSDGRRKIHLNTQDLARLHDDLTEHFDEGVADYVVAYRLFGPGKPGAEKGESASSDPGTLSETSTGRDSLDVLPDDGIEATDSPSRAGMDLSGGPKFSIRSVFDLVGVTVVGRQGGIQSIQESPFPADLELMPVYLPELIENLSTEAGPVLIGRVNINRAPESLIAALPGMSAQTARAVVLQRADTDGGPRDRGDTDFQTPGWLFVTRTVTVDELRAVGPYITTRGDVYRCQIFCRLPRGGQFSRVEALLDLTGRIGRVRRMVDLSHLGRGFSTDELSETAP